MTHDHEVEADRDPSDTLIRHRDILQSSSFLGQGLTVIKILVVMLVLFARLRVRSWLDARRADKAHD